jgi:hypothetical protein
MLLVRLQYFPIPGFNPAFLLSYSCTAFLTVGRGDYHSL